VSEENTTEVVDSSTNEDQQKDNPKQEFSIPTEAANFVGEGKKYQSVEDALSSVPHAQKHIQTLESELAEVKEELVKRKTTEELLEAIQSGVVPQDTTEPVQYTQDNLEQLVNQALENRDVQKTAHHNAKSVSAQFIEKYAEKAEEVYNSIAKENGMTVEQLNGLSASSPDAVLKLSGLEKRSQGIEKSSGTVNTEALSSTSKDKLGLSARVKQGATTKDLVDAWKIAGDKAKQAANA
jgi:hypothetical protein